MTPTHEQWAERAQYDLDTAKAMLDSGRYVYVVFCCQQAIEKMLKAIIAKQTGEMPPRIHNLMRLVDTAELEVEEGAAEFFRQLSNLYVRSRYPEEMPDELIRDQAVATLARTKDIVTWLLSIL